MKRRALIAGGLATLTAATIPARRLFAADTADVAAVALDGKSLTLKGSEIGELRAGRRDGQH